MTSALQETDGRRVRGERSRARILESAVRIASLEGLEGLTFGKAAAAAGAPKSTVQALFRERERLQAETLQAGLALVSARLSKRPADAPPGLARLRALMDAWFEIIRAKVLPGGCLLTASALEYRTRPGPLRDLVMARWDEWRETLRGAAQDAKAAGELPAGADLEQLVFELTAFQMAANLAAGRADADGFDRARVAVAARLSAPGTAARASP